MSDEAISSLPTASALAGGEVIAGVQSGGTVKFPETFWQRSDAELGALAALVSAADKFPYFTGSGTASLLTIVAAIRTVLASADVSTMRTNMGLAIGSNVQAYDAELAALAGLTSAADSFPYFTGSGSAALLTIVSAVRTVLASASVAAMRTAMGITLNNQIQSYVAASASITTATATNVTSITLTTGTWLISGCIIFALAAGTVAVRMIAGISQTTGTLAASPGVPNASGEISIDFPYTTAASTNPSVPIPTYKYTVSGSVTFYLVGFVSFSISTATFGGFIQAVQIG